MGEISLIGREIYPLLIKAGFLEVNVSPGCLRGRLPPTLWMIHKADLHRHGEGSGKQPLEMAYREADWKQVSPTCTGPPNGWRLLLHVLQGSGVK